MQIKSINTFFETHRVEISKWSSRAHKNSFFEIVYVEKGSGTQCINHNTFEYKAGDIFLLPPLNCHWFDIKETSTFYFIRFTDDYFMSKSNITNYKDWFEKIGYILSNYNKIPGNIIDSDSDREYIIQAIKSIHKEYQSLDSYSESIMAGMIVSILNILVRNIGQKYLMPTQNTEYKFNTILHYINANILDNEKLKMQKVADEFNVSVTYFSEYFKRHSEMSYTEYILRAKLKLAKTYILHTDLSIKEIAFRLNFTDSSHLSKIFKKYNNKTIKEFKQRVVNHYENNSTECLDPTSEALCTA